MAESTFTSLIETSDYHKGTLLIRQLKDAGYSCKIEQKGDSKENRSYEIQVKETDFTQAQQYLFGEAYEPDYEGKYAAKEKLEKKLKRQSVISGIALLVGLLLKAADRGNGDMTLLAFVGFGICIWYAFEMSKTIRLLYFPAKKQSPY